MAEPLLPVEDPVARDDAPGSRERRPWRVEGARDAPDKGSRASQMPGGRRLLWIVGNIAPDGCRAAWLPARSAGAEDKRQRVASGDSGPTDLDGASCER